MYEQAGVGDLVDVFAGDFQTVDCFRSGADFDGGHAGGCAQRRFQFFADSQLPGGN